MKKFIRTQLLKLMSFIFTPEVKFKKLHPNAVIPTIQKTGDCGMDLTAVSYMNGHAYYIEYDTELALEIPEGYVGLIFPRSSNSNSNMVQCNSVAVIDQNYRGSIKIRFFRNNENRFSYSPYKPGDRIGQLIIMPLFIAKMIQVEELSNTNRGSEGFGSSDR